MRFLNRSILLGLLHAAFFAGVLSPSLDAQTPGTAYTTARVRLRQQPSVESPAVTTIPRGGSVKIASCASGWCAVTYASQVGYAAQRYLSMQAPVTPQPATSGRGYYNSRGEWVPSPQRSADGQPPAGASAQCRDGTYSFSRSRRGTCSHHGGVARWL